MACSWRRCHVALHSHLGTRIHSLWLKKGARSRSQEDEIASRLLVWGIAEACGVMDEDLETHLQPYLDIASAPLSQETNPPEIGVHELSDSLKTDWRGFGDPLDGLLLQKRFRCVEFCGSEVVVDAPRHRHVILPGSFNPLHEGHRGLLEVAQKVTGLPGLFEIAVLNADKGLLSKPEVEKRVAQFTPSGFPVILSVLPIFTQKAELFRDCVFVVGYDTAVRLVMPKYYADSRSNMFVEFEKLRQMGCSFLVAGRKDSDGTFKVLEDMDIPAELQDLFKGISESEFRTDISSTELRKQQGS